MNSPLPQTPRIIGRIVAFTGIAALASALVVNPWLGVFYRDIIANYQDVMQTYSIWSAVIGVILIAIGSTLYKRGGERLASAALFLLTLSFIVLGDRLLLAWIGLPHWIPDPQLHHRHRPDAIRVNTSNNVRARGRPIRINQHGFHDARFPLAKPPGEFRGLIVGDSVVMGWGCVYEESFANQMETWLNRLRRPAQIINAGTEGYATSQERHLLEESLHFAPDLIAVGFCMNDITDPYLFDERLGGSGESHSIVRQAGVTFAWLANETGFGRLLQKARANRMDEWARRRSADYNAEIMAQTPVDDPKFKAGWEIALRELATIYATGRHLGVPVFLLVLPHTRQLFRPDHQLPQRTLIRHAGDHGAQVIDFTPFFEKAVRIHIEERMSQEQLELLPSEDYQALSDIMASIYYIDTLHLSAEGHRLVASLLLQTLVRRGIVDLDQSALMALLRDNVPKPQKPFAVVPDQLAQLQPMAQALLRLGYRDSAVRLLIQAKQMFITPGERAELEHIRSQLALGQVEK